jgi:hypothetical protein
MISRICVNADVCLASTLKRHGYYCRSRRVSNTSRPRSCIACAKGKARCDNRRPECSRCLAKSIECYYPTTPWKGTGTRRSLPPSLGDTPSVLTYLEGSNEADVPVDASTTVADLDVEFNWGDPEINFSDFLHSPVIDADMSNTIAAQDGPLVQHSLPSTSTTIHMPNIAVSAALNFSIPSVPREATRSLVLKSNSRPGSNRVVTLILHTLKSYPQMMLRDGTLPPYIHPHLVSSEFGSNDMESLHNCISLVRMIGNRMRGSRKLFWKNVRLECERMSTEVSCTRKDAKV